MDPLMTVRPWGAGRVLKKAVLLLALVLRAVVLEIVEQLVSESGHVCGGMDGYWQGWNLESSEDADTLGTAFYARDGRFAWRGVINQGTPDFARIYFIIGIILFIPHRHSEWYRSVLIAFDRTCSCALSRYK